MKLIFSLTLFLLSINAFSESADSVLREALIGSWVKSKNDSSYNEFGFITEYKADGTVIHRDYASKSCKSLEALTTGKWTLENGYLTIVVETSKGTYPLPIGASITDKVIRINGQSKILETSSGKKLLRTKSAKCV